MQMGSLPLIAAAEVVPLIAEFAWMLELYTERALTK